MNLRTKEVLDRERERGKGEVLDTELTGVSDAGLPFWRRRNVCRSA